MKKSATDPRNPSILDSYAVKHIMILSRPDIDRIVVVPRRTIYINVTAAPGASLTRLIQNVQEPIDFQFVYLD